MAITVEGDRDFDVQQFVETVQGRFAGKNALMGSTLASQRAIVVNSSMPFGRDSIGNEVTVPYFGILGDFANNADGSSVTPSKIRTTNERATVGRSSLAFEVSRWARNSGPADADPYVEGARQVEVAAQREMDSLCITAAATTPLVLDRYSSSTPVYLDYDFVVDGRALWGDEQDDIVAMVTHSRAMADLRKLRDAEGRPLLTDSMREGEITRFCGIPLVVSDRVPLTGSTMTAVTSAGTTPPTVTLSGTPTGPWNLVIDVVTGGSSNGTATFRFSVDGGNTYSATYTIPNGGGAFSLDDSGSQADIAGNFTADSLVGNNGKTGITATFANGTYNADNTYTASSVIKATSFILQAGSLSFWYAAQHMALETDKDILAHTDVAAMHMYRVAHLYRRRRGGRKPGVVALKHNVRGFAG